TGRQPIRFSSMMPTAARSAMDGPTVNTWEVITACTGILESHSRSASRRNWSSDETVARKRSRCDTIPTTRPSERTGRWRMRPRRMIPSATSRVYPAASVTTSRRMRSRTFMRVGGPNSVPARAVRSPLAGFPRLGTAEGRSRSRGGFALPGGKQAAVAVGPGVGGAAAERLLESGDDPVGELLRRRDDLEPAGPALDRDDAPLGLREPGALRHVRDAAANGRRVGRDVAAGEHDAPEALAAAHLPARGAGAPGRAREEGVADGMIAAPGPPREHRAAVLAHRGCGRGFRLDRHRRLLLTPGPAPVEAPDQTPALGAHRLPFLPGRPREQSHRRAGWPYAAGAARTVTRDRAVLLRNGRAGERPSDRLQPSAVAAREHQPTEYPRPHRAHRASGAATTAPVERHPVSLLPSQRCEAAACAFARPGLPVRGTSDPT